MTTTIDDLSKVVLAHHQQTNLASAEAESAEELFACAKCGSEFNQLFQFDLCRKCLQRRFNKLIPVINKVRI
jgi:protein-arginine kinase activator protein McsA